ncbi:hypothetical protein QQF64_005315, partial [Cirrhinus molitorella]
MTVVDLSHAKRVTLNIVCFFALWKGDGVLDSCPVSLSLALGLFLSVCMHSHPSCAKISIQEETRGLPHHQRAARGEKEPALSEMGPGPEPLQPTTAASTISNLSLVRQTR